jgi:hypothetical protein
MLLLPLSLPFTCRTTAAGSGGAACSTARGGRHPRGTRGKYCWPTCSDVLLSRASATSSSSRLLHHHTALSHSAYDLRTHRRVGPTTQPTNQAPSLCATAFSQVICVAVIRHPSSFHHRRLRLPICKLAISRSGMGPIPSQPEPSAAPPPGGHTPWHCGKSGEATERNTRETNRIVHFPLTDDSGA